MPTNQTVRNDGPCRCDACAAIHAEFISQFGRWPDMSHAEGQRLRRNREANEASWRRAIGDVR